LQDWTFTLPASQNYRITVNSPLQPIVFTLIVTLDGGGNGQPQRLTFNNSGQAEVPGSAAAGISPQYIFFANAGQQVRVNLISAGNLANFSVRGVTDNVVYKQPTDPTLDWTFTLPVSQDYIITVSSPSPVGFTLQVDQQDTELPVERITFAPGQSSAVVFGLLPADDLKYYVVSAVAGQQLYLRLVSDPAGSANFVVNGVCNGKVYKPIADPARAASIPISVTQDYLITLFAPAAAAYQLEVAIPTPPPPPPPTLPPFATPIQSVPSTNELEICCQKKERWGLHWCCDLLNAR
jgi:hypothetical protein